MLVKFKTYEPSDIGDLPQYGLLNKQILKFFKDHSIGPKELVMVDENFEDDRLFHKLLLMYDTKFSLGKYGTLNSDNLVAYTFDTDFPLVMGNDAGFTWFVLPRTIAIDL